MARFDVFEYRFGDGFLLDVQSDLLDHLNTRLVVPLLPLDMAPLPAKRLNPIFEIDGDSYMMVTQYLSAIRETEIGSLVKTIGHCSDEITNAIDMAFQGF